LPRIRHLPGPLAVCGPGGVGKIYNRSQTKVEGWNMDLALTAQTARTRAGAAVSFAICFMNVGLCRTIYGTWQFAKYVSARCSWICIGGRGLKSTMAYKNLNTFWVYSRFPRHRCHPLYPQGASPLEDSGPWPAGKIAQVYPTPLPRHRPCAWSPTQSVSVVATYNVPRHSIDRFRYLEEP